MAKIDTNIPLALELVITGSVVVVTGSAAVVTVSFVVKGAGVVEKSSAVVSSGYGFSWPTLQLSSEQVCLQAPYLRPSESTSSSS